MGKSSVAQSVEALITPVLNSEELELVDVEYQKEGKDWTLRVFIDKPGGITVQDCQAASHRVEDMIEIDGLIPSHYILEVSSPGLDRPLKKEKDFLKYKGRRIRLTTFSPINNQKKFKGTIQEFKEDTLFLEDQQEVFKIPLIHIAKAILEIEL